MLPGSRVSIPDARCATRRVTTKLFTFKPDLVKSFVWTHGCCVCNEAIALRQRHQLDDGSRYTSTIDLRKMLAERVRRFQPVSQQFVIDRAVEAKKRRLLEVAKQSLALYPLELRDGRVRMFLKPEKSHTPTYGVPRCIQYRLKRYCLLLATYLYPIEHSMYEWVDESNTPIFAKARNLIQRGGDISAKMALFNDPVAISLDHSKFDSHVNSKLLKLEHWFYQKCYPGDKLLAKLLNMQLVNKGYTKHGTKYTTSGTRMSGDQNTSCGNSLLNYAMTLALGRHLKIKMAMYVDGDDFIIFVDRKHVALIDPSWYEQFGMKTGIEGVTSVIEHIEFCQCRPVFNGRGYTMVRNPARMLSRIQWYIGRIHPTYRRKYLTSVGLCEMALGMGLPVGQYVGETLAKLGGKYVITSQHHMANKMPFRPKRARVIEPSLAVRLSYEEAWGVSVSQQRRYELMQLDYEGSINDEEFEEQPFVTRLNKSWGKPRLCRDLKVVIAEPTRRTATMEMEVLEQPEPHCCQQV